MSRFTTRPTLRGRMGMAASTHWLATGTAQSVLERGGNAFDAAVAGCLVLHVAEPHLNGPGGDLVGLVAPRGRDPRVLAGQGPAPAGASIAHLRSLGLTSVPGAGGLAAAVPGAFPALLMLLRDLGTWEFADVARYAIDYARTGVRVDERWADIMRTVEPLFREHWPASYALWMPAGRAPRAGETVTNPVWAATLERLVKESRRGRSRDDRLAAVLAAWREGFVARAVTAALARPHRHADGGDHAGVLAMADFLGFRPAWERPVTYRFRGADVVKPPAWGSGPVLLQTLAILSGFPDAELDPSSASGVHAIAEAFKLAFADREGYYGEGADAGPLLGAAYNRERAALIGERAAGTWRPGGGNPYVPELLTPDGAERAGVGEPTVRASGETRGDTCHLDVVDEQGNIASITPSGGWLQSSPAVPDLGFCAGTRLQMTWLDERSPAALRPGRRPRTTLSPTLVMRDGEVVEALGTPGGDQQDQWQLPYLLRRIVGGSDPQEAVDAPAFHTTHVPSSFWPRTWTPGGLVVEDRLGDDVIAELRRRGHAVTVSGPWSLGRLSSVGRDPATGELTAAANPRGGLGYAAGR
ncbi:transferase [Actinoplanes sp. OR16]|uniref:gamma-glutamyltransferase family protein n=1 Tax=Actinoplanes sp. OR16 TaxID=946334 RepID=UPI000F6E3EEC|nr:gamma-glutamyltransferase [Actinoplanes sp. OR16]BBH70002.1 transferase [Actinoplanes sp. OR16]